MIARSYVVIQIMLFAILAVVGLTGPLLASDKPLNLVLIVSDDQGWTDFGFMGHPTIHTPHLDQLASESLLFKRGYVTSSLCRPSLATMLTGQYPHTHKICGNDPAFPGMATKEKRRSPAYRQLVTRMTENFLEHPNLMQMLGQKGYRSLQTGKWWEGDPKACGFTHAMSSGDPNQGGRHGDAGLEIGRTGIEPVRAFINEAGDQPFFVWYAPMMPHTPHTPPQRLFEKYASQVPSPHVARYFAMCEWFDESVGELLSFLNESSHHDDTLVVFITDNGWIQLPNSRESSDRSKRSPYDGGLRTPIMFRMPKLAPQDSPALASSIDLLPTILTALNVPYDASQFPGINLLDSANGTGQPPQRNEIYGEIFDHDMADVDDPAQSLLYQWIIRDDMKLVLPHLAEKPTELFHLPSDPHETKNLIDLQPELAADLSQAIKRHWKP